MMHAFKVYSKYLTNSYNAMLTNSAMVQWFASQFNTKRLCYSSIWRGALL